MTPVEALVTGEGELSLEAAERLMTERKVKKLPLVDRDGILVGLITAKDIVKQERLPFATRDAQGRLRVGAAIGAKGDYLERAAELDHGRRRRDRDRHRARPFGRDGTGDRGVPRALRRLRARRRQRRHRRGRHVSRRARRQRGQSRHRARRRLHHAHHHQLRRAAGRGAGRMPPPPARATAFRSSPTAASAATARSSKRCSSAATR